MMQENGLKFRREPLEALKRDGDFNRMVPGQLGLAGIKWNDGFRYATPTLRLILTLTTYTRLPWNGKKKCCEVRTGPEIPQPQ